MHNIDSTQTEYVPETSQESGYELTGESSGQAEYQGENYEFQEMSGEMLEALFNEADEMALAAELLEVSNEQELEQFLGRLIKKAGRFVGKVARSPIGSAIGGVLKNVAKVGLPIAGGALGTFLGGPIGGMVGKKLGSFVGGQLEQENFEMQQEQEFEMARQFVRTAGAALRYANRPGLMRRNPRGVARTAVWRASRRFAPYLGTNFRQRRQRRVGGGSGRPWSSRRDPRFASPPWGFAADDVDPADDGDGDAVDSDQGESAQGEYAGEFGQGEFGQGEFGQGEFSQGEFGQGEVAAGQPRHYARSGQWVRRGRTIMLTV